jgi:hypothetical protein
METPINAMNGSDYIAALTRSQTYRFQKDWKENVLSLGVYKG